MPTLTIVMMDVFRLVLVSIKNACHSCRETYPDLTKFCRIQVQTPRDAINLHAPPEIVTGYGFRVWY